MRYLALVFTCTDMGAIDKVIINNVPTLTMEKGDNFIDLFDEANYDKAQHFFLMYSISSTHKECELVVKATTKPIVLYFKGIDTGTEKLILAESDFDEIVSYYAKMMSLNNQLVNSLRNAYKSNSSADPQDSEQYLAELSTVNNELITIQRELSKKNIELARLNDLKNQLVGMAAHDLRNPLGIISSFSDFILDDMKGKLNDTNLEFLQIIKTTSVYMLKMVEGILDLTYIQSGKIKLNLSTVDFNEVFTKAVRLNQSIAAKKDIRISYNCTGAQCMVKIDMVKIQQVLSNIFGNAIKYSPAGSTITAEAYPEHPFIVVKISDQGQGIPEKDYDIIFEPFQKSSVVNNMGEQSTGLGLAICKNIIVAHRGRIWLESNSEVGSTFYFSLPMALK